MKEIILSDGAPKMLGAYSQGVVAEAGRMVFCSGQIAIDPKTNQLVAGGIREQTTRVIDNLVAVLEKGGSSLSKVVKVTVFLTDMGNFAEFNEVYGKRFADKPPARATVEVSRLPKDVLIEMDAIAIV